MAWREFKMNKDPGCPACGESPTLTGLIDYEGFCGMPAREAAESESIPQCSAFDLSKRLRSEAPPVLLDVREADEVETASIDGSRWIPLGELEARIGELIGGVVEGMPWLGTFHAIGVKIMRRHAELVDLKPSFTVLDTDDQIRLIKQLLEAENIDEKRWPARGLAGIIDDWKNKGLHRDNIPKEDAHRFANGKAIELFKAYQSRLLTLNAVDYGDLITLNIVLFQKRPDILEEYRDRFRHFLDD